MKITEVMSLYSLHDNPEQLKGHAQAEEIPELLWAKLDSGPNRNEKLQKYESVWATSGITAVEYAERFYRGRRFLAGEPAILRDAANGILPLYDDPNEISLQDYWYTAFYWNDKQAPERWPEIEKYILKNPEWAYTYALSIIKGRWPEAEPTIMTDPRVAQKYISKFKIKNPGKDFEIGLLNKAMNSQSEMQLLVNYVIKKLKINLKQMTGNDEANAPINQMKAVEIMKQRLSTPQGK